MEKKLLILGGGPAGLSTALHLAQLAPNLAKRVLIIEKEHYPRPKLCAGGLVADAEILLEGLGLDTNEVPHVDAQAAHFQFAGKGMSVRNRKRHTLRIVRRDEFDHWLAKKAKSRGIEIREGVTVKSVQPDENGVTVETDRGTFTAEVVIGADGSNGITRRCTLPHTHLCMARLLETITPTHPKRPGELSGRGEKNEEAYFDFLPVPKGIAGYVWDFPTQVKGEPMRCWGIYDMNISEGSARASLKETLAEEMGRHGFDLSQSELKGNPIQWFDPFNKFSVPRILLVGDAAGVDPLFGEGISMALGYGKVAAYAICDAFRQGDFSFRNYRQRILKDALGQTLTVRWFIAQILYAIQWKWFQALLWRGLKPIVLVIAWLFILNWAKRTPSADRNH